MSDITTVKDEIRVNQLGGSSNPNHDSVRKICRPYFSGVKKNVADPVSDAAMATAFRN